MQTTVCCTILLHNCIHTGLRLGLYGPIRDAMHVEHSFLGKLAAGVISGAGAAAASNPLDLVKTRLQVWWCMSVYCAALCYIAEC